MCQSKRAKFKITLPNPTEPDLHCAAVPLGDGEGADVERPRSGLENDGVVVVVVLCLHALGAALGLGVEEVLGAAAAAVDEGHARLGGGRVERELWHEGAARSETWCKI